jgi:protein O-GlcNAc transferase
MGRIANPWHLRGRLLRSTDSQWYASYSWDGIPGSKKGDRPRCRDGPKGASHNGACPLFWSHIPLSWGFIAVATVADVFAQAWSFHQAGSYSQAEQLYRQALRADPTHADSWCFLGAAVQAQGKVAEAEMCFRRAAQLLPDHPSALNCLGVVLAQQGKHQEAGNIFQELVQRQPRDSGAFNNLGLVRAQEGRWHEAVAHYRQALAIQPDFDMAQKNLTHALQMVGQLNQGQGPLDPMQRQANFHNDKGVELAKQGLFDEAATEFERALQLKPTDAKAHSNLGNIYYYRGNYDDAIDRYRRAVELKPDYCEAHSNLGNLLLLKGRADEALASCREAVRINPNFPGAYLNLGNALREKAQAEDSVAAYREVLRLEPESPDAHSNLAGLFTDQGDIEQATIHYEHAVRLRPSSKMRILRDTLLPTLYQSADDLLTWRKRLTDNVRRLHEEGVKLDLTTETPQPPFFLAYQGYNDRDLMRDIARLYVAPPSPSPLWGKGSTTPSPLRGEGSPSSPSPLRGEGRGGGVPAHKLKVGLISKYFKLHTIGHWMRGLVAQLSREDFDVTVFSIGRYDDEIARFFKQHADHYLEVPKHLPSARKLIADEHLDVLFYTDIGMDQVSYTLAFSRLAPVQCVALCHPITSGIETIDYYIST